LSRADSQKLSSKASADFVYLLPVYRANKAEIGRAGDTGLRCGSAAPTSTLTERSAKTLKLRRRGGQVSMNIAACTAATARIMLKTNGKHKDFLQRLCSAVVATC